jgi:RecJ-like exonuclease
VTVDELDPFVAPSPSHQVGDVSARSRVVLRGLVVDAEVVPWDGGPVLEVTISDGSGAIRLAFLGRHRIGGVEHGRVLTVAGMVGRRHGRPLLIDPWCWLHAPLEEGRHA